MSNYVERSLDVQLILEEYELTFYIELVNKMIKRNIKRTNTATEFSWNSDNVPLMYLTSKNGDGKTYGKDLRYDLIIPLEKLYSVWHSSNNETNAEFEKRLYYLYVKPNTKFGIYKKDNTFINYINLKLYYDKIIMYKNNKPDVVKYRLSGIENIEIKMDYFAECEDCGRGIFGKYEICNKCKDKR